MSSATSPQHNLSDPRASVPALARLLDLVERLVAHGDWIFCPVSPKHDERLKSLTGMDSEQLKKASLGARPLVDLRRKGSGCRTRYFVYRADLVDAMRRLSRD